METQHAIQRGALPARYALTVEQAANEFIEAIGSGRVRSLSGERFKPYTINSYKSNLFKHVVPTFGGRRFDDVRRREYQEFIDRLAIQYAPSTVRNVVMPLRTMYREALQRELITTNPLAEVKVPLGSGRRERIVAPSEASSYLSVLSVEDRPVWATAFYAGLRRGELRSLAWDDVDLDRGVIHVRHSFSPSGDVAPKTRAGRRDVPITDVLAAVLCEHHGRRGTSPRVFPGGQGGAFGPEALLKRARAAWASAALPEGPTLHECRHTFASVLIAAGIDAKAVSTYMGHADIRETYNRYGHLFPDSLAANATRIDEFLKQHTPEWRPAGRPIDAGEKPAIPMEKTDGNSRNA